MTPTWTLPILSGAKQRSELVTVNSSSTASSRVVTTTTPSITQRVRLQQPTALDESQDISDVQRTAGIKESINTQATTLAKTAISQSGGSSWTKLLVILWGIGIVACWLRNVWQHVLLKRLLDDCTSLDGAEWNELLTNCSQSLGIKQEVLLLKHSAAYSPVSAGAWKPAVILPENAEGWDINCRRSVLLHELAHVARRDVLTQTVAGIVSGLYWFNPICWLGLFQMRKLRELACDDLVLRCGQQPSGYADVLLGIARSYQHQNYSTTVGMVQSEH